MSASKNLTRRKTLGLLIAGIWFIAIASLSAGSTKVTAWGDNSFGQTNLPPGLTNVVGIAQGGMHGLALNRDSTVTAWGYNYTATTPSNYYGQAMVPVGLSNVVNVAAGYVTSLALKEDGTVVLWGDTREAELVNGLSNVVALAAGDSGIALCGDGTVTAWGSNLYGQTNIPAGLKDVIGVAAGGTDNVALLSNRTVVVWGWNGYNQTNVPASATNVVAVAAGLYHLLALRGDGTVVGWGYNGYGQTTIPGGLSNVIQIAAGSHHSLALKSDGKVVAWGYNNGGQTTIPAGLSNVVAISASRYQSLALANDGAPWILNQPLNQTRYSGVNTAFTVLAMGRTNLTYQWRFNGTNLPAATNATLALANVQPLDSGSYSVVISNPIGSTSSSSAVLSVITSAPIIVTQPTNPIVALRSNVLLSVTATGSVPLRYQWQFMGTNIFRATNAVLSLTNAQWTNEGSYHFVITNSAGATTGASFFLNVLDIAEAVNTTNLIWTTSGSGAWFPQGTTTQDGVAAAQSASLPWPQSSILQTTVTGPGTVNFWWKVYQVGDFLGFSANGSASQASGTFSPDWQRQTVYIGAGNQPLQWAFRRTSFSGTEKDVGWLDQVSFVPGGTPPFVTSISGAQALPAGTNITLSFAAAGTPPLQAQWQFNGTNLPAATNSTLSLTNLQELQSGSYTVLLTNAHGWVTSNISLTVLPVAPRITIAPTNQAIWIRSNVTFQVGAQGSQPFAYQWRFNGVNIPDATNATLALGHLQQTNAGKYSVVVSNDSGSTASTNAVLAVLTSALVAWGNNTSGQTTTPASVINPIAIGVGEVHNLALNRDGTVVGWGSGGYGQTTTPAGLTNVVAIATEAHTSLALTGDGAVVAWGWNFYGQTNVPARLANVVQLAGGGYHSLAVREDGSVVAWGRTLENQVEVPPDLTEVVTVGGGGFHSLAVKRDGTIVAWGDNSQGQCTVPAGVTNAIAVSAGAYSSMALRSDGTVLAWGANGTAQTKLPPGLTNIVAIAGDSYAVQGDGTLLAWGDNTHGQTNIPAGLSNVVAVTGDAYVTLALVNDGSPWIVTPPAHQKVYQGLEATLRVTALGVPPLSYQWQCSGTNLNAATNALLLLPNRQPGDDQSHYRVIISNALGTVTSALATLTVAPASPEILLPPSNQAAPPGGTAWFSVGADGIKPLSYQWRFNGGPIASATNATFGVAGVQPAKLGNYDVVISNNFGAVTSALARLHVTQIIAWGNNVYGQTNVPAGLSNIVAISAGFYHALALQNNGTVSAWGAETNNLLPILDYGQTTVPAGLSNVIAVAGGGFHSLALKSDGTIVAWGYNGDGETTVPPAATNVVAIATSSQFSLALKQNGTVVAWGLNDYGQASVPVGLSNVIGIAAGVRHAVALKSDGTVVVWGNQNVAIPYPAGLTNVIAVAAGGYHTIALKQNGTVVCWGRNAEGESTPPIGLSNVIAVAGGYFHSLALKADGSVNGWGYNKNGQINIAPTATNVTAIAANGDYSVVLLGSGQPFAVSPLPDQVVYRGQTVTFAARAWGTPPIAYQWLFAGTNIAGATNASLVLTNIPLASAGPYQLSLSNSYGVASDLTCHLTVLRLPIQFVGGPGNFGMSGQAFQMQLSGLSGHGSVIVYASTNLINWLPIFTNPPMTGVITVWDSNAVNIPVQFYRAVEE